MLARINATEKYMEAAVMKARIAACSAMVITTNTPMGALGKGIYGTSTDETSEYSGQTVTPGMIYNLKNGESAQSIQPAQDGIQVQQFMSLNQRLIGSSAGLSYEATSRDMSQTNYSSARQGRLEDGAEYDMMVDDFKKTVLKKVNTWFINDLALMGMIPGLQYSTFTSNEYLFLRHEYVSPAQPWIDPYKEARANEIIINEMQPQDTLANICQRQGLDWREVIEQRTAEAAYIQQLRDKANLPMVNTVTGGPFDVNATNNA
jgi:capsid protein